MTHRRIAVSMLGTTLLALAIMVPAMFTGVLSGSVPAGAASANHTVKLAGPGTSLAYEPKAKVKFTCNSNTGAFTLTGSGIQVFGSNHVTPWDTTVTQSTSYWISFWIDGDLPGSPIVAALTQDPTTGLYGTTTTGNLNYASECATGVPLLVFGGVDSDGEVPPPGSVPTLGPGQELDNQSLELSGHLR
jgi:hypothetical protein